MFGMLATPDTTSRLTSDNIAKLLVFVKIGHSRSQIISNIVRTGGYNAIQQLHTPRLLLGKMITANLFTQLLD